MTWTRGRSTVPDSKARRSEVLSRNEGRCQCAGCSACAGWQRQGLSEGIKGLTPADLAILDHGVHGKGSCVRDAVEDDHIIPVKMGIDAGLRREVLEAPANHQGLCVECHAIKSRAESVEGRKRALQRGKFDEGPHPGLR